MRATEPPADRRPPRPMPVWVASLLIQVGSFALVLGLGVLVVSAAYGGDSLLFGLALVATGYVAVGLPGWYVAQLPRHRAALSRFRARIAGRRS